MISQKPDWTNLFKIDIRNPKNPKNKIFTQSNITDQKTCCNMKFAVFALFFGIYGFGGHGGSLLPEIHEQGVFKKIWS